MSFNQSGQKVGIQVNAGGEIDKNKKLMVVQSPTFCPFEDETGRIGSELNRERINEHLAHALNWAAQRVQRKSFEGFPHRIDTKFMMCGLDAQWMLTFYGEEYSEVVDE